MTNELQEAIQGGFQQAVTDGTFKIPDQSQQPVSLSSVELTPVDKPVETTPAAENTVTPPVTDNNTVLSNTETPSNEVKPETPLTQTPDTTPAAIVDFDKLLDEKTGGKFKKYEELQALIDKPEPKLEFANESISKINEYVAQGRTPEEKQRLFDDYQATQMTDFTKLNAADQIAYHKQLADPDMNDAMLNLEMELEYRLSEWKENAEDYEGGVEPREITLAKMKFERDANRAQKSNMEHQEKWKTPRFEKTPQDIAAETESNRVAQEKWSTQVDTAVNSLKTVSIKMSDTENVDYVVTPEVQKEVAAVVKQLWVDPNAAWKQFVDEKTGAIDANGIATMIVKARSFEAAMKIVAEQARVKGSEQVAKDIKNIQMTVDGKPVTEQPKSTNEQISDQIADQLLKRI